MAIADDIQKLIEIEKDQERLSKKRTAIFNRIQSQIRLENQNSPPKFPSKIRAIEFILKKAGNARHVKFLSAELGKLGFLSTERTIAGMLRRYSSEGRTFTAEGGNIFGLLEWSSKK